MRHLEGDAWTRKILVEGGACEKPRGHENVNSFVHKTITLSQDVVAMIEEFTLLGECNCLIHKRCLWQLSRVKHAKLGQE